MDGVELYKNRSETYGNESIGRPILGDADERRLHTHVVYVPNVLINTETMTCRGISTVILDHFYESGVESDQGLSQVKTSSEKNRKTHRGDCSKGLETSDRFKGLGS